MCWDRHWSQANGRNGFRGEAALVGLPLNLLLPQSRHAAKVQHAPYANHTLCLHETTKDRVDGGDLHCSPQGHDEFLESTQVWMEGICIAAPKVLVWCVEGRGSVVHSVPKEIQIRIAVICYYACGFQWVLQQQCLSLLTHCLFVWALQLQCKSIYIVQAFNSTAFMNSVT